MAAIQNADDDITNLAGRTMAYGSAGRLHQATHTPACLGGVKRLGQQTTTSHHNGHGQRFLRTTEQGQSVFVYGTNQYTVLAETHQTSALATSRTEHIYLPTASGPMPVIAIMDGQRFAVHSDHLNTPRRLTDASNRPRWQWAYSAFGDVPAQSLPAAGLSTISYSLRYPGQVDDFNGLFYNFNRFYDPRVGRYTQSDPIGLEGGWNRFGYVGGNALGFTDPDGLQRIPGYTRPNNARDAAGYHDPRGNFVCEQWNCPSNPGTCSRNDLKRPSDFLPAAASANVADAPSGCTCTQLGYRRDWSPPMPDERDLADAYNNYKGAKPMVPRFKNATGGLPLWYRIGGYGR